MKRIKNAISEALKPECQCCFCGEKIKGETPLSITVDLGEEQFQSMYAHGLCLQEKLHPTVPFLTPEEFNHG